MNLKLTRPLCIFDLETTGTQLAKDRIVEISILKVYPNGNEESHTWLVNPEMPIPQQAAQVHGITDEDVADKPTFKELAPEIASLLEGSDLGGYNSNRFDVPLLAEEFLRVGKDFNLDRHKLVDAQVIFFKKEPRNLSAAYAFYCDKELSGAHSAEVDAKATFEILDAQVAHYDDLENGIDFLSAYTAERKTADLAGFIGLDESGVAIFLFGKYKGKSVAEILEKDRGYFSWLQNAEFPRYTKKVLTAIRLKKHNR
ncbi:MAG: 3'-5' exonuclease [Flavobacteriales bacterium]